VQIQFYEFIRPEKTFENVEEMKKQIDLDIEKCKKMVREK
jgi:FAD synthase